MLAHAVLVFIFVHFLIKVKFLVSVDTRLIVKDLSG